MFGAGSAAPRSRPRPPARSATLEETRLKPQNTWMNGRIVPWDESRVHVNTDAVLRGASVFEGLRAYRSVSVDDLLLFRVGDHMRRLFGTSMRFLRMRAPYGPDELLQGAIDLLRANRLRGDAHLRVVVYFDEIEVGHEVDGATGAFILAFERPPSPRLTEGVRTTLSPWRRLSDTAMSPRVKASANYLNGRVAGVDARAKGFDSPVMLNDQGRVSEGPGQNVFLVRDGVVVTPRITDAILEGVTRATLIGLARQLGVTVEEREVDPTELYIADELFFAGTAWEVTPVVEIDTYRVGDGRMGPLTARLQRAYLDLVRGAAPAPEGWLTSVYGERVPA
jgi:branched-chain amino acid aminotransferase